MNSDKKTNRWSVVVGGILIQMCLGAIYTWSVFRKPLQAEPFNFSLTQASLPFALVLVFFALSTIVGGRWLDKKGPKVVATTGGILLAIGLVLAGLSKTIVGIAISYGVIGGIGVGLAYGCPIATGVKWFPDMRGLITGLSVFGFGAASLIFAPIAKSLIASKGVGSTFITLGIIFLIVIIIGAQFLKNPPAGWLPEGFKPSAKTSVTKHDFSFQEMLKTKEFYLIWIMYFIGCAAGLMIIGQASPIGQDIGKLSVSLATVGVMVLGIFNAFGRIFWGKISDSIGRIKALFLIFIICGITILLLNIIPVFPAYFWIGISLVGLCFGGYLAIFPAITADYYGTKNSGVNYGFVFTAYGFGGLLSNLFAPKVLQSTNNNYSLIFVVVGILCLVIAMLTFLVKPPVLKK
ncbi:MAG: OFA family MFS transporter [bacterium]|nr:OFA family MFS transporter [bacterium]